MAQVKEAARGKTLWMRFVHFEKVKDLLHIVHENNGRLRAGKLEQSGMENGVLVKNDGQPLAHSPRYNYRKAMENLGLVEVKDYRYYVFPDRRVLKFLELTDFGKSMSEEAKEIIREIIVENDYCKRYFFNVFMRTDSYNLDDLRSKGIYARIEKRRIENGKGDGKKGDSETIILRNPEGKQIELRTQDEIYASYWSVRLWSRDLEITDEIMISFSDGRIIYPVNPGSSQKLLSEMILRKVMTEEGNSEWSLIHIPGFVKESALSTRISIPRIKKFLIELKEEHPKLVMLVPSSTAFIDIRTPFEKQDPAIRNSYLYIPGRGYFSHLRIHKEIQEGDANYE